MRKTLFIITALVVTMAVTATYIQLASSWAGKGSVVDIDPANPSIGKAYSSTRAVYITTTGPKIAAMRAFLRIKQDAERELNTSKLRIKTVKIEESEYKVSVSAILVTML